MPHSTRARGAIIFLAGAASAAVVAIAVAMFHTPQAKQAETSDHVEAVERLTAERAWYRWYFSEYAAALRLAQYGEPTRDINHLLHAHRDEFIAVEEVTIGRVCPRESHGAFSKDYIYFTARAMPLPHEDGLDFYAMSYLGAAGFAHNGKVFDALLSLEQFKARRADVSESFGLAEKWLSENSWRDLSFEKFNDYGHSAVMSYNAGDIDGDDRADFVFERWLILSSHGYARAGEAPRRSAFMGGFIFAVENDELVQYRWTGTELEQVAYTALRTPAHSNVPYVLLPLPDARLAVRTANDLDIYGAADLSYYATITGLSPGEVQTGALGDFTGDGQEDVWLAQVATPARYPDKLDQIVLIRMNDIKPGRNTLREIAWFTIRGSARYSDYDGIGTTLSPRAGDILGDGLPDLSFTGHRHMNESGALYILPGKAIRRGGETDISRADVIKILGRPMSQLAPPFHHWDGDDIDGDGYSDIIMPVDNDLCAGLNAGAMYTLSGQAIAELWASRNGAVTGIRE